MEMTEQEERKNENKEGKEAIHVKDIEQSNLQEKKSELSYAFEWMIYPQGTSKHTREARSWRRKQKE